MRANLPEQKEEIIAKLLEIWLAHPQLRLGQLIGNLDLNLYYVEDFNLIDHLEAFYDRDKSKAEE